MVLPQYQEFLENNASSRHALLTTILAYHLYEWVHGGKKFSRCSEDEFRSLYPSDIEICSIMKVAGHLTNGTKHFGNKDTKTRTQTGFISAFSDAFARPLNIILSDGNEVSADVFLGKLIEFWKRKL
ncbi:MAG: hypothetical protein C0623_04735 [Desulfuromonas sp.]|nr:MAG: hypothetical protein C0623_04735 [Desulfuromonas sp.]